MKKFEEYGKYGFLLTTAHIYKIPIMPGILLYIYSRMFNYLAVYQGILQIHILDVLTEINKKIITSQREFDLKYSKYIFKKNRALERI